MANVRIAFDARRRAECVAALTHTVQYGNVLETTDDDLERNWTKWCYALCGVPVTVGDALPERARDACDRRVESWVTFGTAPDDATVVDADGACPSDGVVCLYVCGASVARVVRAKEPRILRPQPRRASGPLSIDFSRSREHRFDADGQSVVMPA